MKDKISAYFFLIISPVCFYVFQKESPPHNYFFLLLTIWFLYMFINQKAKMVKTYVQTENIFLSLIDIAVGFAPLIGSAIVYLFQERSIFFLYLLMIMTCFNLFIKLSILRKTQST